MEIVLILLLLLIFFALLSIDQLLKKQLKQSKDLEDALYRIIEISKSKDVH